MYLIEILHQTTTSCEAVWEQFSCILSKFYIKPQRCNDLSVSWWVVSYRNSTSNHNSSEVVFDEVVVVSYRNSTSNHNLHQNRVQTQQVVSYRNSTSNHNWKSFIVCNLVVVSYRNSTSNHNLFCILFPVYRVVSYRNSTSNHNCHKECPRVVLLYLIEILHQTTTVAINDD